MDKPPRLAWNAEVTAEAMMVTPDVVKNLHRTGKLRGVKVGRSLRWRPSDVERFVAELGGDDV